MYLYLLRLTILIQQKAEPPRCLALRARIDRLKSSFVPWELSLPTEVAHGHGQHAIHDHNYTSRLLTLYPYMQYYINLQPSTYEPKCYASVSLHVHVSVQWLSYLGDTSLMTQTAN